MSTGNEIEQAREQQIFSALLTPHRSLNRTGFLAVMLFLSAVSFVTGIVFLMNGWASHTISPSLATRAT